jgi:hypothetical protein
VAQRAEVVRSHAQHGLGAAAADGRVRVLPLHLLPARRPPAPYITSQHNTSHHIPSHHNRTDRLLDIQRETHTRPHKDKHIYTIDTHKDTVQSKMRTTVAWWQSCGLKMCSIIDISA